MARKTMLFALVLGGAAALAQAQMATDSRRGEFTLGVSQTDSDTLSSKFLEYRDIPNGLFAPAFRFSGEKNELRYDFWGIGVRQKDQAFKGFVENDSVRLSAYYNQIPHSFGNAGRTLLEETRPGVWELSNTVQQTLQTTLEATNPRSQINYAFLSNMLAPSLSAANTVDLRLSRERGSISFTVRPDPVDISVTYFRERRVGSRAASGTSFGFNNVVELPEPLHYLTQDFGASAQLSQPWGAVRAGVRYNWFANRIATMNWDNPFRITNATDAAAYLGPGSSSIAGPAFGQMALPPDNDSLTGSLGFTAKLGDRTRLIADASYGQWQQNETPFIPYTTNTAIVSPLAAADIRTLPAARLDGKIDVTNLSTMFTTRPADRLTFTARYRIYDLANKTPELRFPGYVRFDGVWEDIPRVSVPYAYKSQRFDAALSYDFGPLTLEGGFRESRFDRHFRETEETREDAFSLAADVRKDWFSLRAGYERAERDYQGLEIERSEEASFQIHSDPVNLYAIPSRSPIYASLCGTGPVCNLRYDQAKKESDRLTATLGLTPDGGKVAFVFSYRRTKDDYAESRYGLTLAEFDTWNGEVTLAPGERATLYAFYTYEDIKNDQRGRQSGGTISANPLDDWISHVNDKVNSFGAGGDFTLVPEKWFLNVSGRWQKVDGDNAISAPAGGAPANARAAFGGVAGLPLYDDTKLLTLNAELKYNFAKSWSAAIGGFFEDYEIRDSNTSSLLNYVPGSFFLAAFDGDYQAKVGYVRLSYRW